MVDAKVFRYPGVVLEPSPVDAEEALCLAEKVFEFVLEKVPEKLQ